MSFKCGIVGLPNVGKSTLFNALTNSNKAQAANFPFCTIDPNIGVVPVPDKRLENLAKISKSKKIINTSISFVDIAGLVKGASKGEGLGNKFLSPHQLLEDPCNVTRFTGDDEGLLNVINQHTLCISKYDYSGAPLKIGDVVSVSYNPGDAGPIDLQHCYFDSIEQVVKPEAVAASKNNNGDCSKLSEQHHWSKSVSKSIFR